MKGEAEAFAMEAKGRAEAEQMSKKAEAFKQYKDGAMVDMLLEKLPLVSLLILLTGFIVTFKSRTVHFFVSLRKILKPKLPPWSWLEA